MDCGVNTEQALAELRAGELPWSTAEVGAALADSLEALELVVELEGRSDDELLDLLGASGGSLVALAELVRTGSGDDGGNGT